MHHARLRTALQKLLLFCWLPAFGAAPEFTPMESCFSGSPGSMPQGWINFKNAESGTGLTNNFQWDGHPVFRIVSGKDTAVIHSATFEFPSKGILRFSVWARATVNNARIKLLIVGDSYRSYRTREAMLTETFQRVTVEMPVPVKILKSNTFWFRIDAPPTGNDFLIAKVKTELLPPVEVARQTGNILTNGEFHFGASGFQREYYNRIVLGKTAPVLSGQPLRSCRTVLSLQRRLHLSTRNGLYGGGADEARREGKNRPPPAHPVAVSLQGLHSERVPA